MSEGRLTNVWCWKPEPGLQLRCYEGVSGLAVDAASREEAIDHFNQIWNFRSPVEWKYQTPPRPRHPGEKPDVAPAIEGEGEAVKFHRLTLRAFHPDLHGAKKRWSVDEIITAINDAWQRAKD